MSDAPLLSVDRLSLALRTDRGDLPLVEQLSLQIDGSETLALVGESGCGKSLTALALLGLLPNGIVQTGGEIRWRGRSLASYSSADWRALRGEQIGMIFQEPMSALNPAYPVGAQIAEALRLHRPLSRSEANLHSVAALAAVGIADPAVRAGQYPHQLSGGMRQRVMIAMALACEPALLIADEPTTALDVTIQAQILDLLHDLQTQHQTAILFISHDLAVVAKMADRLAVMYAGRLAECGPARALLDAPQHPYSAALLATTPRLAAAQQRLPTIAGRVPAPAERGVGCHFAARCQFASEQCQSQPVLATSSGRQLACHHPLAAAL
jgi:peptide/nickel transport system ATP-binding protein